MSVHNCVSYECLCECYSNIMMSILDVGVSVSVLRVCVCVFIGVLLPLPALCYSCSIK